MLSQWESVLARRGATSLVPKLNLIVHKLMRQDLTSHMIYYVNKQFLNEFTVSIATCKSSSLQHDIIIIFLTLWYHLE